MLSRHDRAGITVEVNSSKVQKYHSNYIGKMKSDLGYDRCRSLQTVQKVSIQLAKMCNTVTVIYITSYHLNQCSVVVIV